MSGSESSSAASSSDESFSDGMVDINFDFAPLSLDFSNDVAQFLAYLLDTRFDHFGLADVVSRQATVGSVVRVDDTDVVGVASAVDLSRHSAKPWANDGVVKYVKERGNAKLAEAVGAKKTTLLLNQRMGNIPEALAFPLHMMLIDEMLKAAPALPCEQVLVLATVYKAIKLKVDKKAAKDAAPSSSSSSSSAVAVTGGKRKLADVDDAPLSSTSLDGQFEFVQLDDSVYFEFGHHTTTWPIEIMSQPTHHTMLGEVKCYKAACLVDRKDLLKVKARFEELHKKFPLS
jgi:hypothetical protein